MRKNLFGLLFLVLAIAAAGAGVSNVYADVAPIERAARLIACQAHAGGACRARLGRMLRSPLFQDLEFQDGGRTIDVRCRRALYLVGDFSCALHAP